jgi:hypothetical protein
MSELKETARSRRIPFPLRGGSSTLARLTRPFHVRSALRRARLRIDPDTARALVDEGAILVDVRRTDDPARPLPGAIRLPPDDIPRHVTGLRPDVAVVLACT